MKRARDLAMLASCAAIVIAPRARAQDETHEDGYGARAVVEAPIPGATDEDPTAAGTAIDARDRAAPAESVQDVLHEAPGARVLETGAFGSFAGVALRGAELAHTSVLFGVLPLGGPDTGTLDLSLVPLAAIDRVEVYRGGAPVRFGDGAIGGVVRLVPRSAPETGAGLELRYGSFDTVGVDAWASAVAPAIASFTAIGVLASDGAYPYLDDGGTRFIPDDDVERTRENADLLQAHGLLRTAIPAGPGEIEIVALGVERVQGEPGPASAPGLRVRRTLTRAIASVGYHMENRGALPHRLEIALGGGHERNRLADRFAEIGILPRGTDDGIASVFARVAGSFEPLGWLELGGVATARYDRYAPHDAHAFALAPIEASERGTPALAIEARAHGRVGPLRLELRPSVRLAYSTATVHGIDAGSSGAPRSAEHFIPTFRVGGVAAPTRWLAIAASFATGSRVPSILELFGDRAVLLPSPDLVPERSIAVDAGLVARGRAGVVEGVAEARFFFLTIDDLIRYRRTAQHTAIAENIESGETLGVEAGVRGEVTDHFALAGALTYMESRASTGLELPFRPALVFDVVPEAHTGPLGRHVDDVVAWVGVTHVGANHVDAANLVELPARTWIAVGARVELWGGALFVGARLRDLEDARGSDLLGYPLPGRRFDVAIGGELGP